MARGRKNTNKQTISIRLNEQAEKNLDELVEYFKKDTQENASIQIDISRSAVIEHLVNTEMERIRLAKEHAEISPPTLLSKIDKNYVQIIDFGTETKDILEVVEPVEKREENTTKINLETIFFTLGIPSDLQETILKEANIQEASTYEISPTEQSQNVSDILAQLNLSEETIERIKNESAIGKLSHAPLFTNNENEDK